MLCGACHTIPGLRNAEGKVGPKLSDMQTRAARVLQREGYTGTATTLKEYIRESILAPNTYLALECPAPLETTIPCVPGIMPQNFGERLTAQQLETLIDYLVRLKEP